MSPHRDSGMKVERTVDLLTRARSGDEQAWEQLYERYESELRRRVHARLGTELRGVEDSMDVFQSVWREAIGSLEQFEYRGEGSFLAWLATVLRNKLASQVARNQAEKRGGGARVPSGSAFTRAVSTRPVPEPGPESRVEVDEDRQLLLRTVEQLPPEPQELVRWALLEGLSHQEIGARLGISKDAARMRVARASARLTAEFRRLHGGA